eukprot:COSAG01_NODE_1707_length_9427_cov_12.173027_6_plen_135_part_00
MPDVFSKLAERAGCFQQKEALNQAFLRPEYQQMGVAVPGGLTTMVLGVEADLRMELEKRSLALDIRNMFNELCRVSMEEDLVGSLESVGVDLTLGAVERPAGLSRTQWERQRVPTWPSVAAQGGLGDGDGLRAA